MKKITILFTFLSLLTSCGRDYVDDLTVDNATVGQLVSFSSVVSDDDITNARSICDAFRSKRLKAIGGQLERDISYLTTKKDCQDEQSSKQVLAQLHIQNGPSLILQADTSLYMTAVETDSKGHLSQICSNVLNNEDFERISYPDSGVAKSISFNSDGFTVSLGVSVGGEDKFKLTQRESYKVVLSKTANRYGFVRSYISEGMCSNSSQRFVQTQSF